ncbi:MAG TPA: hypothetical protein VFO38_00725 [Candidatus Saccharimonadales bacterium]|nr:hypothetical protein [Candidatus Saccharimonadales bacterium]
MVLETEKGDELNWYTYFDLATALYEHCEALWQVFGRRAFVQHQLVHMNVASIAFGWVIEVIERGKWSDTVHKASLIDLALSMRAVVDASWERINSEHEVDREDARAIVVELIGEDNQPGQIVGRSARRAQEHPSYSHLAGQVHVLAHQLNCGGRLGYHNAYNPAMTEQLPQQALDLLDATSHTMDRERTRRQLWLNMAMEFVGNPTIRRKHATLAYQSAKQHGDANHANRAWLIRKFGRFGNRLHYVGVLAGMVPRYKRSY